MFLMELLYNLRCSLIIPYNSVMQCFTRLPIESNNCLPLVSDTDSLHILRTQMVSLANFLYTQSHIREDSLRVMLIPTWVKGDLFVLSLLNVDYF